MYMLRESDGDAYDCLYHRYNNTKRFFKGRSREVRRGNRESKTWLHLKFCCGVVWGGVGFFGGN